MKKNKTSAQRKDLHPGSSVQDAKALGGKGDFGAPESNLIERAYVSTNTKRADPGAAIPRAGADESRTSGVGGNQSGDGSSSGGDIDTDIIGIRNEPDEATGSGM